MAVRFKFAIYFIKTRNLRSNRSCSEGLYGNSGIVERCVWERCRVKGSRGDGEGRVSGRQWCGDGGGQSGRERRSGQRVVIPGYDLAASSSDDGRWNSGHRRGHGQGGGREQSG